MEQGYAGTADLIARVGPKTFVIDYKTGKAVYPEARLQVEAYRQCTMLILKDGTRISMYPMAEAGAVVLFKDDGTFSWTETTADHTAFLAAMILFLWRETLP
jgi:RecB family exonuclease